MHQRVNTSTDYMKTHQQSSGDREQVQKLWGREEVIQNNELYCGKLLFLEPGFRSSLHYHPIKDETMMCIEGAVLVELPQYEDTVLLGWAKESLRLLPGTQHRFTALGPGTSVLVEFSTPHSDADVVRLEESQAL